MAARQLAELHDPTMVRHPVDALTQYVDSPRARFCTNHRCGASCCENCRQRNESVRLYYAHIEHTGGSSIECAAVEIAKRGLFLPMGHSTGISIQSAMRACWEKCGRAPLAISVRDPFAYHETLYRWKLINPGSLHSVGLHWSMPHWPLHSFADWIRYVTGNRTDLLQSSRIQRACGLPCEAEAVIHTERLADDLYLALRRAGIKQERVPMQRRNAVPERSSDKWRPIAWTPELIRMITTAEGALFEEFGYTRRAVPSEIPVHNAACHGGRPCLDRTRDERYEPRKIRALVRGVRMART